MKNLLHWSLIFLVLAAGCVYAQDPSEAIKIKYLISSVEGLEGAKFIRNGRQYEAQAAADHLRLKLRTAGKRIRTAEDFITRCGSKSSVTGEVYRIRFSDGSIMETGVFFREKLKGWPADKPS